MRSVTAYPGAPAALCTARTTGRPAAVTASQIASTWSARVIEDRSASADSSPGSVSAVTSWPSARRAAATSSHAHAPSQNPGTRTMGAVRLVDIEHLLDRDDRVRYVEHRSEFSTVIPYVKR